MVRRLPRSHRPYRAAYGSLFFFLGTLCLVAPPAALSQNVRTPEQIARLLTLDKVHVADGVVSGEVINSSPHTMRDVQVFIRYTWLWDNETKPGKNDPGTSAYYTLPKEIPSGGRSPFTFKPSPPLPKPADGRFEITVTIAGFTEVIPQDN
jgi:hypothetical protein